MLETIEVPRQVQQLNGVLGYGEIVEVDGILVCSKRDALSFLVPYRTKTYRSANSAFALCSWLTYRQSVTHLWVRRLHQTWSTLEHILIFVTLCSGLCLCFFVVNLSRSTIKWSVFAAWLMVRTNERHLTKRKWASFYNYHDHFVINNIINSDETMKCNYSLDWSTGRF